MTVVAETGSAGRVYRAVLRLRETAGAAATIASVDLTFTNGSTVVFSSHHDRPISDTANSCPANGTVDTRELRATDADLSHAQATTMAAKVSFSDGSSFTGSATASADVPPASPPPAQTYTLTGVIHDSGDDKGIEGSRVEVVTGPDNGKSAVTDGSGTYVLNGLAAGSFRVRASANGYDSGEQGVTVPDIPRADFTLRRSRDCRPAIAVSVPPNGWEAYVDIGTGCLGTANIDVPWILIRSTHGGGRLVDVFVMPNSGASRVGHITFSDSGRAYQVITFTQDAGGCVTAISPTSQNFDERGGSGSIAVTGVAGCSWQLRLTDPLPELTFPGGTQGSGSGTVTFTLAANRYTYSRSTRLNIGGLFFGISENACPISLSAVDFRVPAAGATYTVNVTGSNMCLWTATTVDKFITVTQADQLRPTPGTVTFTVAPNTTGTSRSGSLGIGQQTVRVTQDAT